MARTGSPHNRFTDRVPPPRFTVEIGLTDGNSLARHQREVLETALEMGYFEYPKDANAGDVAAALDISRSTLAEHLATARGKPLGSVVASE